jgi:parvulin-like peptidyl-prolyl isomerase
METFPYTPETYYDYLCEQALNAKVKEYIDGLATVTDEDTQAWYDETLAMQQEEMDADPQAFADTVNSGYIYTYVPEDTVAVKQILLAFDDDLKAQAQELYDADDAEGMMALVQDAEEELKITAEDIKQQLENGADIDALIEEYNDDPGMTTAPGSEVGYLVESRTSTYIPAFSEAALGLMNVGDVSEPVITYNGVHILQSIKVYKKGVISYEDLYDDIKEALLPTKQQEKYDEITQQWLDEADIVYHYERLKTPKI